MDKRLSWPGWLTYSDRFTHINGHLSATGRAHDRESSPAKDWCSTTVPCNQASNNRWWWWGCSTTVPCNQASNNRWWWWVWTI